MGRWGIATLAAVAAVVTACSPSAADDATGDETTTSTTRTPRITDDSGRPPVTFDPCYDIPDDVMNAAGYDAAKKEVADYPMGTHTFLGCTYRKDDHVPGVRRGYSLSILSGNVTLDEELAKNGSIATETSINERRALLKIDQENSAACKYVLQTNFGVVFFNRLYNKDHAGEVPQSEWCSRMEELVISLEPFIGNK
ncbi:DUF3558 domain-containing protein [Rhodococcus pyridinivorans]|uniref:DUF3558 domain-containing protein n=1 Tax=Rhodococcus pyridinivorans TaxID=103816 RepID=UPI00110F1301|nr:DUF3558 domain-containing protein [Rhodococcus pyridinivorans]